MDGYFTLAELKELLFKEKVYHFYNTPPFFYHRHDDGRLEKVICMEFKNKFIDCQLESRIHVLVLENPDKTRENKDIENSKARIVTIERERKRKINLI